MASGIYISGNKLKALREVIEFPSGNTLSPASATGSTTQEFTLSITNISNKFVTLASAPENSSKTRLTVVNGIEQQYGVDFQITPDNSYKTLSWASLGLDGVLSIGDILIVTYK
jgi:hypothetical protein